MDSPAAWYPDPDDPSLLRWWDGTEWTSETVPAPVAPAGEHAPARRRRYPRPLFWILSALVVLAALIGLGSGGIGSFLVVLGVATGATAALYALIRKRPSWAGLPPGIGLRTAIVALSAALVVGGGVAYGATHTAPSQRLSLVVPTADHATSSEHAYTPVATQTPTPTPTPIQLADYAGQSPASAEDALEAAGFAVTMSTSDGSAAPADWTGWTVAREVPAGGQAIAPGSTVTLVMSPPVPPPAAPAPAPAAPVPPVAPGGGATAQCNDGTYSYAAHHQGACSHHGGVRVFYK